ncbi:acyl-CoA dehydrogenase family protein [Sphingomonas sp. MMS24-JH45]
MNLSVADREALVDPVRRLLADRCTESDVRRIMDTPDGHDPALWRAMCDLGIPAIAVAETDGGLGLGATELGLVMEEAGAALLPAPLLSSITAAALLAGSGDPLARRYRRRGTDRRGRLRGIARLDRPRRRARIGGEASGTTLRARCRHRRRDPAGG